MRIGCHPPGLMLHKDLADTQMVSYCVQLTNALRSVHQQVKAALPVPASGPLHDLQPGDWVVIKDFRRKKWHQPRWRGPYQVLLTTPTAVRVEGHTSWGPHQPLRKGSTSVNRGIRVTHLNWRTAVLTKFKNSKRTVLTEFKNSTRTNTLSHQLSQRLKTHREPTHQTRKRNFCSHHATATHTGIQSLLKIGLQQRRGRTGSAILPLPHYCTANHSASRGVL